ncbi:MAG TPA: TetR family transcriptional regulator [Marmoricola sp.]|nr:TetR family transcriptional regulator [Marmoricola sp.]
MTTSAATDTLRDRLLAAAADFTTQHGWSQLTMGGLAGLVGVSRQTVYNELGSKPELAEAMVLRELEHFLRVVDSAFEDHPPPRTGELAAAIGAAAERVLRLAEESPLLHAVLSSSQGAESDLLPLLTTHSEPLLAAAGATIREHVERYDTGLDAHRLEVLIDMVVRLVLSHVMNPSDAPSETARAIAWIAGRVLG